MRMRDITICNEALLEEDKRRAADRASAKVPTVSFKFELGIVYNNICTSDFPMDFFGFDDAAAV